MIHILSDDTGISVLQVIWLSKLKITGLEQIEKWNMGGLHINDTVTFLGYQNIQLLGMHEVTGFNTGQYPFNEGIVTALSTLRGVFTYL